MIPTITRVLEVKDNVNLLAFYEVIAEGESNHDDDAHFLINGGGRFTDLSKHPFEGLSTRAGGKAAGKPQFIPSTWAEVSGQLGLTDFGRQSQYYGFIGRVIYRDALDDVLSGNLESAISKCRLEWTSLPGASENKRYTLAGARAVFQHYGGILGAVRPTTDEQAPVPIEDLSTPYEPTQETKPMAPVIMAILSGLASSLPALAKIFNDGGAKGQKVEALAPMLSDAIVKVTDAVNLQEAAEKVQKDPAVAAAANKAVEQVIYALSEVGGGVEGARAYSLAIAKENIPLLRMPTFVISLLLLAPVAFMVGMVLGGKGFATLLLVLFDKTDPAVLNMVSASFSYSPDMQNVVITNLVGVIMIVAGFWLGLSYARQKNTSPDSN